MIIYPYHLPPANELTEQQRDGIDCVYCGTDPDVPMAPVGHVRGTQVFAHDNCADAHRMEVR